MPPPSASVAPPGASPTPEAPGAVAPGSPEPRRRTVRGFAVAVVAILLAVAAVVAFGLRNGSSGGTAFSPIAEAAARTGDLAGGRISGTGSATSAGFEMTMTFEGAFEQDRSAIRMETQTPAAPQIGEMMSPFVGIQDGATMYMSSPAFSGSLPDGKSWMSLDLSELTGGSPPASAQAGSMDPRAILTQLELVSHDVRTIGTERIKGLTTTHYAATIDPALQAEQLREAGDDLVAELVEKQGGTSTVDVWIDRKGLVRRTAMTLPFEAAGGPGASMSMTMDFHHFGEDPEIQIPPGWATFDATEIGKQGLEQALGS